MTTRNRSTAKKALISNDLPTTLDRMINIAVDQLNGTLVEDYDTSPVVLSKVELIQQIQKQPWHDQQNLTDDVVASWISNTIKARLFGSDAPLTLVPPVEAK